MLRGFWGQHDICPQKKGRSVLEYETNVASHLEISESDSSVEGVYIAGVRNWSVVSWGKGEKGWGMPFTAQSPSEGPRGYVGDAYNST